MEYTVQQLASLSGVSGRTLRYYDEIGLLTPRRLPSGYRVYGPPEVERLQQILLYRRLALPLEQILELISAPGFSPVEALRAHEKALLQEQQRLAHLLANVQETIQSMEGGNTMTDEKRFEALKEDMIAENEHKYGKEVRDRWGDEAADTSNQRLKGMTQEQFDALQALGAQVNECLRQAMEVGDTHGEKAREAVALHLRWLGGWGDYPPEAHKGLGDMYVADARFAAYYDDAAGEGAAQFLRDAIYAYYAGSAR